MKIQWKRLSQLFALPVAMTFMVSAQAAFVVDDFETQNTYSCSDPGGGLCSPATTPIDAGNTVWGVLGGGTATRELGATLISGDSVTTAVCSNCLTGEILSDAGPSVGEFFFEWNGDSVDLSGGTLSFDWVADVDGATWYVDLGDGSGGTWDSDVQAALPGGGMATVASIGLTGAPVDLTDITTISLHFNGVERLDANIDNVMVSIPEPGVIALFSVGLLGLGWSRRRRTG